MYTDVLAYCRKCHECAVVMGAGRQYQLPLDPIPIKQPFQNVGVDIMALPCTENGNKHVVVFQDMFTKWTMVYAVPYQKTERITKLLCKEIAPFFGVPEARLSNRGTNLLSNVMLGIYESLGITKLNTNSYHPQCTGMVERFNRTLKAMLQ